jgi:hypothetical protein
MMDSILIIVTVASLALAISMGVVLFLLMRDDRRRSNARAAMLSEMADVAQANVEEDDLSLRIDLEPAPAVSNLFAAPPARSAWPRRAAIAGALAIVVAIGAVAVRSGAQAPAAAAGALATAAPAADNAALLELMSLTHVEQTGTLTITGLVQNPRHGTSVSKITATAMLFAADGTFLASGRAPLDFTTLRAGDESGFVINVSVSAPVARYRVGFRGDNDQVIAHVDRRTPATIARGPS